MEESYLDEAERVAGELRDAGHCVRRKLHSLAGGEQEERARAPVEIGDGAYEAAVREQLALVSVSDE